MGHSNRQSQIEKFFNNKCNHFLLKVNGDCEKGITFYSVNPFFINTKISHMPKLQKFDDINRFLKCRGDLNRAFTNLVIEWKKEI